MCFYILLGRPWKLFYSKLTNLKKAETTSMEYDNTEYLI